MTTQTSATGYFLVPHEQQVQDTSKTVPPMEDALTKMGFNAVSQATSVPADSVLAVLATLLTGLAGQDAMIRGPIGPTRLPKVDLLTYSADFRIQRLIEQLTTPLEAMQRRLSENMGRNSPDAMELLTGGAYSSPATAKIATQEIRDNSLRRQMEVLSKPAYANALDVLRQDLTFDPVPHTVESLLHPRFLINGADGRSLKSLVEDCHRRNAILIRPKLELARQGSEPARVMKILCDLMDGEVITKRPASFERGRDPSVVAKVHALLALHTDEIQALAVMGAEHFNRFLWLKPHGSLEGGSADKGACSAFMEAYQGAVQEILALRREGRSLMVAFESDETAAAFQIELAGYEAEMGEGAGCVEPWARGLPQTLFWAMAFLRFAMPPEIRPGEGSLVTTSFAVSRRLVGSHNNQVLAITRAKLLEDRHRLARRIVGEVEKAESPQTFRVIARYTHIQKKEFVAPVVDALIEVGVLVRDEEGVHTLGPVDLTDAMEILDQKFVQD